MNLEIWFRTIFSLKGGVCKCKKSPRKKPLEIPKNQWKREEGSLGRGFKGENPEERSPENGGIVIIKKSALGLAKKTFGFREP